MAITVTLAIANSSYPANAVPSESFDGGGLLDHHEARTVDVPTSEYTWTIDTDIVSAGLAWIKNHDATNYVRVGFATTVYYLRLRPGQSVLLSLEPAQAALFLIADTATCKVSLKAWEA